MISVQSNGIFSETQKYLQKISRGDYFQGLDKYAQDGVAALAAASPFDSGLSSESWTYKIEKSSTSCTITWYNRDVEGGFPVAIMLQYGYATGTGGYVQGRDYINPAMKPVFDKIADNVWKVVSSL